MSCKERFERENELSVEEKVWIYGNCLINYYFTLPLYVLFNV